MQSDRPLHNVPFPQHASTWQGNVIHEPFTPSTGYEDYTSDIGEKIVAPPYADGHIQPLQPNIYRALSAQSDPLIQPTGVLSVSPRSGQDWMSTSSSDNMELRPAPDHSHLASPTFNTNPPLLRRDGIRKKNARFEIPAERTLRTIDHLINQTCDEQEIKELKQQKRLLRNRQAAYANSLLIPFQCTNGFYRLDSRQRKKQHTERLEEEKKHTSTVINELEEALGEMKLREAEWNREKEGWMASHQQCQQFIQRLAMEKEELVRTHTLETEDLRKKNNYLTEQVQKLDCISMSAVPSSSGYSNDFSDFDHLTMDSSPWENFSMANDYSIQAESKHDTSLEIMVRKEKPNEDRSATSGLLLMLLLCGAWVASNSTSAKPAVVPRMPEEVRVASATVLGNIFEDAGLEPYQNSPKSHRTGTFKHLHPRRAARATSRAKDVTGSTQSPLATLHHQLFTPSEEQQKEQIFSLTAKQYNGIATDDAFDESMPQPTHRRNLAEALTAMRNEKQGPAAQVYTRSLMMGEVPSDVVRDFARMVAECNEGMVGQANGEPLG